MKEFHVATGAELRSIIRYEIANGMVENDTASYAILMEDVIEAMTVEALRYGVQYIVCVYGVYVYVCLCMVYVYMSVCMYVCVLPITPVHAYTKHHTTLTCTILITYLYIHIVK